MNRLVGKNKTILVSGPSSVRLLKGEVSVLGAKLSIGDRVIVRRGKTLPFEARSPSILEIVNGGGTDIEEVDGSTIPVPWRRAVRELLSSSKPCTVIVLGGVDCGKTSFCTFMINKALSSALKPLIIDADLGQSDLGPPATIGLGVVKRPVADLFFIRATATFFIGNTSPRGVKDALIFGLTKLKERALETNPEIIVINTDGWVYGDEAREYKVRMIKSILPDAIVALQYNDELEGILSSIEGGRTTCFRLPPSPSARKRSKEDRKILREQGYRKLLKSSILRRLPINWVKLENTPLSLKSASNERKLKLSQILGQSVLYCGEGSDTVFVFLKKGEVIDDERIKRIERVFHKKLQIMNKGDEKGLLVGLLSDDRDFLGLGVIQGIDYEKGVLKLYTPYRGKVGIVQFGQVKVDRYGKELGIVAAPMRPITTPHKLNDR